MHPASRLVRVIKYVVLCVGFGVAGPSLAQAAADAKLPPGGILATPTNAIDASFPSVSDEARARVEKVSVADQPFDRAIRLQHLVRPENLWDIHLQVNVTTPLAKGDVSLLEFWARGVGTSDATNDVIGTAYVQLDRAPHTKVIGYGFRAGRTWRHFYVPFQVTDRAYAVGEAAVVFHLGVDPQTIELGGIRLINYRDRKTMGELPHTRCDYPGRERTAGWRQTAAERIEKYRKADVDIQVVDEQGKAVSGAELHVEMQRHAFPFGAAVKARMLAMTDQQIQQLYARQYTREDVRRYRQIVERHFTRVVLENDLKWWPWEVSPKNNDRAYRQEWTDSALQWLGQRRIEVRGHYLTWAPMSIEHQARPLQYYTAHPDDLRADLFAHINAKVPAVGDRVVQWDAVNHLAGWDTTFADILGGDQIYATIIQRARRLAPGVGMWVNEGQILHDGDRRDRYEALIRYLVDHQAAPDGIGMMAHFPESSLTPPAKLYEVLDRYARLVPRLQLTEFDVSSRDEKLQADYYRDVMTVAFSHPAMEGIIMWGFWEKAHWRPEAALWRGDWSLKPCGVAWLDLVERRWWTDEQGRTDEQGNYRTRGFLGDYRVHVQANDQESTVKMRLDKPGARVRVVLGIRDDK